VPLFSTTKLEIDRLATPHLQCACIHKYNYLMFVLAQMKRKMSAVSEMRHVK